MANKWLAHVKKTMKRMKARGTYVKGKGLGQVIKEAKKDWKKGGGDEPSTSTPETTMETKTPLAGGRRTRKVRRHGRR
jgi:hypothetical protein